MTTAIEWRRETERQIRKIPLSSIAPNPRQPRRAFDEHALLALAASIRQHGLLQPVTVRETADGYELIMGERRLRACQMLSFRDIDALVLQAGDEESALLALVENLQREELHYFEEAEAFFSLIENGMTHEALAHRLGRSVSYVSNKMRLLKLPAELRDFIAESALSERHARALLPLRSETAQKRIAALCVERNLTVRETEGLVARAAERLPVMPNAKKRVVSRACDYRLYVNAVQNVVRQMNDTGLPASIDTKEKDGVLEIVIRMQKSGAEHRK